MSCVNQNDFFFTHQKCSFCRHMTQIVDTWNIHCRHMKYVDRYLPCTYRAISSFVYHMHYIIIMHDKTIYDYKMYGTNIYLIYIEQYIFNCGLGWIKNNFLCYNSPYLCPLHEFIWSLDKNQFTLEGAFKLKRYPLAGLSGWGSRRGRGWLDGCPTREIWGQKVSARVELMWLDRRTKHQKN